jgi:hypothetical protein
MNKGIYEIKRSKPPLSALQVGKVMMAKRWAESVFDSFEMKNGVIYPADEEIFSDKFLSKVPPYVKMIVMKSFDDVELGDKLHPYGESVVRKFDCNSSRDVRALWNAYDDGNGVRFESFGGKMTKLNIDSALNSGVNFVMVHEVDNDGVLRTMITPYGTDWGFVCTTLWEGPES